MTVTRWKSEGRLIVSGDLVEFEATDRALESMGRTLSDTPEKVTKSCNFAETSLTPPVTSDQDLEAVAERILIGSGATMSLAEAERVKENYLALLRQLEYGTKSGAVVLVADVAGAVGAIFAKVRTKLLAIPTKEAPRLTRIKTPVQMQDALTDIITKALEELVYEAKRESGRP